ncbi:MFS general substrate transporter [Xylona heveae TC161]|uniref:MFS general substrate transporter n=1 Tax=Xylona heveae (strain CBS 132557 / TC161) TaxID=1328760 RepID=A0A165FZW8_XYLHT|nr:MFS general substrate transporter [Xylona heveae TC161]KZF21578.1 MFS general substrate transporter [Xylona heveae TC161]
MATGVPEAERDLVETGEGRAQGEEKKKGEREDGRVELEDHDAWDKLGYSFPTWRKWQILSVVFCIQISMNLNASMYANGVQKIAKQHKVSAQVARIPQMLFLVAYAFGCELWAPWSEEYGRWPIQQSSLFLVNIWQIPCALAPNFGTYCICRFLGGLSTAGGSVTLGVLADMWEPDEQEYAVAFLVLSSVGGSVVGAVVGGFVEAYKSLPWIFWMQLIIGGGVQAIHFFANPETRATILLDREAKRRRKAGETHIYGPNEIDGRGMTFKQVWVIWSRPFYMFVTEPIVLWLSLLSGFSDALIFTFLQSFQLVYKQWGFKTVGITLAFIPKIRRRDPDALLPEVRLWWLLFLAPLETIGLFGFAWTSLGPTHGIPWIAPMIFSTLVGIANYAIYQSSIDYMTAAYGPYAASATGGNDLARDFLAGIAALYSTPMYTNIPHKPLEWASTILACIAIIVTIPIYIFYKKGPQIRERSKFAQSIGAKRMETKRRRKSSVGTGAAEKSEAEHFENV